MTCARPFSSRPLRSLLSFSFPARERLFEVFAHVHLDGRVGFAVVAERFAEPQELPQDVLVRFGAGRVPEEGLVVRAAGEDAVREGAVDLGKWSVEGPVEREEADGWAHALGGAP